MDPHLRNSEALNSKQTYSNSYVPNKNQLSRNWANPGNTQGDLPPGIPSGYSGQYFYKKGQYGESKSFLSPSFEENPPKSFFQEGEFGNSTISSGRFPKHTTIEPDQLLQQAFSNGQGVINPKFGDTFIKPGGPTQQTQPNISFENSSGSFGVSKGFIPDNSFKPNHFSKEFPIKSRNSAEAPFRPDENFHSFTPTPTEDSKEKNTATNAVEDIMNAIQHNQINCVSLLNEVGSKVKKKVDYLIKEVPTGKIKVFECVCVLDKDKIGFGKGNSKQGSKTDSATEGVRTLLSKEQFTYERAHITLSVQKTAGIGVYANQRTAPSTSSQPFSAQETNEKITLTHQEHENDSSQLAKSQNSAEMDAGLMNDSALYELNLIAKECFIEPHWIMSPPRGPNGEFETRVTFDKLEATGTGRKKLDAKRAAALKIIQQIRGDKELSERYNPKAKKQLSPSNSLSELTKNDQRKILFESSLDSKMFGEIRNSSQNWKDNSTKVEKNFESYASNIKQKYELDAETLDALHEFFKLISDFSDMSTRNPKQILMDDPNHLADYVTDCSLVPIGSFALDCMRKDKLIIDALIVFQEVKKISEKDFLELYQKSLLECQRMTPQDNSEMQFKMEFCIESSDRGLCLLAKTNFKGEKITMQIYVSNSSSHKKYDASIVHISKIYDSLNATKLQTFRELMSLIRIWKTRNNLNLLSPELLDVVLLADFLTNQTGNLTTYIINCLITMSSEESFQAVLNKCGAYYVGLYKEIPAKLKWQISSKSIQSVEAIYQNHFDASLFN